MDPVTVGAILLAFVLLIVCSVIFKMVTRERSFDDSFDKAALKLLTEDKSAKSSSKSKNGKIKKTPSTKSEKRVAVEKSELSVKPNETISKTTKVIEVVGDQGSPNEHPKNAEADETTAQNGNISLVDSSKFEASALVNASESNKSDGKKSKRRSRKEDSLDTSSESKKSDQAFTSAPFSSSEPTKITDSAKKSSSAPNKAATLDSSKDKKAAQKSENVSVDSLVERLSTMDDIEPAYVAFLRQFIEQTKQKESALKDTIATLRYDLRAKDRDVENLHDQATTSLARVKSLELAFAGASEQASTLSAVLNSKQIEINQLRENIKKLEDSVSVQNKAYSDAMERLKRESEQLATQLRISLSQANNQIAQKDVEIKQLHDESAQKDVELKQLLDELAQKEKCLDRAEATTELISQRDAEIQKLRDELAAKQKELDQATTDAKRLHEELEQKEEHAAQAKALLDEVSAKTEHFDEKYDLLNEKSEQLFLMKEQLREKDELIRRIYEEFRAKEVQTREQPVADSEVHRALKKAEDRIDELRQINYKLLESTKKMEATIQQMNNGRVST